MPDIAELIRSGAAHPWLYLPVALLLGALHALEPGHAKSVMAAFIVAIRGTSADAVLLGISAAIGHTLVVWGLAILGLWLGDTLVLDRAEPWLVLISGLLIVGLALRLLVAIRRETGHAHAGHHHGHGHDHEGHDHDGHDHRKHAHAHEHAHPHPHGEDHHGHHHATPEEIDARYGGRRIGAVEIAWFGFTGGLMPCPAAIAVLLVCLQMKAFTLGIGMVAAFSVGLAVTLVAVGLVAAWGSRRLSTGWAGYETWAGRLPYVSAALVLGIGLVITARGVMSLGLA